MSIAARIERFIGDVENFIRWRNLQSITFRQITPTEPGSQAESSQLARLDQIHNSMMDHLVSVRKTAPELAGEMERAGHDCTDVLAIADMIEHDQDKIGAAWGGVKVRLQRLAIKLGNTQAEPAGSADSKVKPCEREAYQNANLAFEKLPPKSTPEDAWRYIKANPEEFEGYRPGARETFAKYYRSARRVIEGRRRRKSRVNPESIVSEHSIISAKKHI